MRSLFARPGNSSSTFPRTPRRALRALLSTTLTAGLLLGGAGGAQAVASCSAGDGFTRLSGGALYRVRDTQLLAGSNTMAESGLVGTGWGQFAWTGAGGDGVLYALTKTGQLKWFRYDYVNAQWMTGSGAVIGSGFTPGVRVVNIALAADGWFYTVQANGSLVLYHHTGRLSGTGTWSNNGGYNIGTGWTGNELLAPQGDGVLYRQYGGNLYWFRHSDPSLGPVTWANSGRAMKIGVGWKFYDLLALGGGVLLATSAPTGQVSLFQHAAPTTGATGWTVSGRAKYQARADSYGITMPPSTCTA